MKLPVWLLFYWTTPEAAWSTEPVSPLMAASFAADERQLRIIIYDVKILNSTFSLPDFLHVSFKFNKCMHMYAYKYIYMLLVHTYIYYCGASHTGDAIRVMYSSVSVGVVHVLCACAQVQSTV